MRNCNSNSINSNHAYNGVVSTDALASTFFAASDAAGYTLPVSYKAMYNGLYTRLRAAGLLACLDGLYIFGAIDTDQTEAFRKGVTMRDLINPSNVATFRSDYAGSHTGGLGFVGDGANFGILLPNNPYTATNFSRNDGFFGTFLVGDSVSNHMEISSGSAGFAHLNMMMANNALWKAVNADSFTGADAIITPRGWQFRTRTGANIQNDYSNLWKSTLTNTDASTAISNDAIGLMGGYVGGAWAGGYYSTNTMSVFCYGKTTGLNKLALMQIINEEIFAPINKITYFNKHVYNISDSIFSLSGYGANGAMFKKAIADTNNHWLCTNAGVPSDTAANINANFSTLVTPYYRSDLTIKNIAHIELGTNDLAAATNINTIYTNLKSIATKCKALGYGKVILTGVFNLNAALGAVVDAQRVALRALILADINTATSVTNVKTGSANDIDYYIDSPSDSNFNDGTNGNFTADKLHMNQTGNDNFATIFMTPLFGIV